MIATEDGPFPRVFYVPDEVHPPCFHVHAEELTPAPMNYYGPETP